MSEQSQRLANFPASFFGMIMGITGLSIAFLHLSKPFPDLTWVAYLNLGLAVVLMMILSLVYLLKLIRHFPAVKAEMKHPVKMNFVPAISISMLLLSIAFYAIEQTQFSYWLWTVGAALQISLTYWVLYNWVHHDHFTPDHSNPAWFIPIVGNIIVPIAGVHHAPLELNWFFFSVGLVFWIVVKSILVNRIIFHAPMPARLIPTLFIFIAPPAVGFISYLALNDHQVNQFAMILYFFAIAVTLLMLVSVPKFVQLDFALSWWAFTFPVAAMVIASYQMSTYSGQMFYQWIGYGLHALLTLFIVYLGYKTAVAVMHKKVCVDH
ncbi:MAG: SLAC1 anion channel family protein [Thiotrichales bacterium]|nr:SLAC1 anion channel family protein [Thiotrichales bacterium]